ncbi:NUDIX domain-containing protein [Tianweitania sp. BSSL-BM11]|uniref:GDP-mannose pyrophosphatase n=1 Tax=Tianweitania aestuarii TaxID=2814886 RepID=A0ABS5RZI1_9HYPH|nr:NUDIX domain-containing protein [Tianweitania aestuarii]
MRDVQVLSDNWYTLRNYTIDVRRSDGAWQRQKREVFDRGSGAGILLYNKKRRSIILARQLRLPAYLNGVADGMMLEVPAGLLDDRDPADAICHEVAEETGYEIGVPELVTDCFASPGAVTERLHLFLAEYDSASRPFQGGGLADEGEDIEVVEMGFDDALAAISDGRIRDAKTILLIYHARVHGVL